MNDAALPKEISLGRLATAQTAKSAAEAALAGGALAKVEQHPQWALLAQLPLKIDIAVPMPGFKVRDLLALRGGQTVATLWKVSEDVPVRIGGVEFGWGEFEVVEQRMAVRLTRLG
jgi:flagellar motor switch protein FliN/FliY